MNHLISLILVLLLMAISFVVGILTMIYGWGLEAQNWYIIIGAAAWSVVSLLITSVVTGVKNDK